MGKAKNNGNGELAASVLTLNQSMAILNQAMATFLTRCADTDARIAKTEADRVEVDRNLAALRVEIDKRFLRIEAILVEHSRILQALPDAVREKRGFKMPEQRPS